MTPTLLLLAVLAADGPADWAHPPHVTVLHRGTSELGHGVIFAGVHADRPRVVVTEGTGWCDAKGVCGPPGFRVETVDYARGAVVERWDAPDIGGCGPWWGEPFSPAVRAALRWSALVRDLGVPVPDANPSSRFTFSADGRQVAYLACRSGDSNLLAVAGPRGESPRALGMFPDVPVFFSPDGRHLAWTAGGHSVHPHASEPRTPGELHVARVDAPEGRRDERALSLPPVPPSLPAWAPDGERIYFVTQQEGRRCLVSTDLARLGPPKTLTCPGALDGFRLQGDGRGVLLYGWNGSATVVTVLALPGGRTLSTLVIPSSAPAGLTLDESGTIVALQGRDGTLALGDLQSGRTAAVKPLHGYYFGAERTRFVDARHFVALSFGDDRHYQIVKVDAAGALGR